ncbi:hypothetical protein NC653_023409 [Populus alba x Populus x berolinensis]|uniref:Uncharacterized protein n=1 Tax=Populus alba x Populus x berolinensis TaxID=444605 RepID=A0AAD6QAX5_9ROSI|nr:hypothetical protein NC653_023409 [Populus alba x Populus x berolinensis]
MFPGLFMKKPDKAEALKQLRSHVAMFGAWTFLGDVFLLILGSMGIGFSLVFGFFDSFGRCYILLSIKASKLVQTSEWRLVLEETNSVEMKMSVRAPSILFPSSSAEST